MGNDKIKANNIDSLSARGWSENKPHTKEERLSSMKKHGKKCFLRPEELKYPVCDKNGDFDCKGIIAAKFWADTAETKAMKSKTRKRRPYSFKNVSRKAKNLGYKLGCKKYKKNLTRKNR